MVDIVYILTNEAMPGLIKIGCTNGELASRIRQLYSTGVPLPFELFYACEVTDCASVESKLHDAFGDHRISKGREFFRLAPERAKAALSLAEIREVRLGDEIFETNEIKAEVEAAKRRGRFRLSMIGVVPGTELQLAKDPKIICTTVDDANKVDYLGNITSLSDAALQAHIALGDDWPAVSGPWAWTYQGKRLDDLRREIEDKSD
jgi:Meiotically up-regulated gene 113